MSETPVLVGIAQNEQRPQDPTESKEPLTLMLEAVRAAAEDAGAPALLTEAGSVRVVRGIWPYQNPARVIAEQIGVPQAETRLSQFGGNFVQTTVNQAALDIQSGRQEVVVITGAECGSTQAKARRAGLNLRDDLAWQSADGTPDVMIGEDVAMIHDFEKAIGLVQPIQIYPMFENALRHHLGESLDDHLKRISELWAGFSEVAAGNPHAWLKDRKSAEEIRTLSDSNRPVSFPYPKFMNSNNNVDQGAALILCSETKARSLGIPADKWIYPWTGTDAHDAYQTVNRDTFYESPAIRIAGGRALELAGVNAGDLAFVDVYSCFPVAVQVGARELGLDQSRPLTVTGGLTFAGGPLNNYVMHSIARMAELLRENVDARGLITANGGYLTKHAFGVYSATPPSTPFQHQDVQAEVDQTPLRDALEVHDGAATVEAYTVMYAGDGPKIGYVSALTDDGRRTLATSEDPDVLTAMTREEFCGRPVRLADKVASF
jgi:acetyl-CoA C-acetyltransferase